MMFLDTLKQLGVIAVIRGKSADHAVAISAALIAGGVRGIEVTFSTPDCCAAIRRVCAAAPDDAVIGVGTVMTVEQLKQAQAAGATFAVSPHFDPELLAAAQAVGLPMLPGAVTPTEIVRCWSAGAAAVKLFPGSLVGPDYVKAIRGPLPGIPLMPTGGVAVANLHEWFAAGVVAVGMGGNLANGTPAEIEAAAKSVMVRLSEIRQRP